MIKGGTEPLPTPFYPSPPTSLAILFSYANNADTGEPSACAGAADSRGYLHGHLLHRLPYRISFHDVTKCMTSEQRQRGWLSQRVRELHRGKRGDRDTARSGQCPVPPAVRSAQHDRDPRQQARQRRLAPAEPSPLSQGPPAGHMAGVLQHDCLRARTAGPADQHHLQPVGRYIVPRQQHVGNGDRVQSAAHDAMHH